MTSPALIDQIKEIIALVYGHDPADIEEEWDLLEDVGLFNNGLNGPDEDMKFIQVLNTHFHLDLDPQRIKDEVEQEQLVSVSDLADLIDEEQLNALE